MRVLLDECVPKRLRSSLPDHEVRTVVEMDWSGIKNGKLLALAAEHFDCFLTVDANIEHQQNLPSIPVAILLIRTRSNDPATLAEVSPAIRDALASIQPRTFLTIVPPNNRMQRSGSP
jgi:predicted nuclease of predicted toxin-antitoxin system